MVNSALLCSADPNFKHNHLQMLQIESLLNRRGGFIGIEAGKKKQLTRSGEAVLGGREAIAWPQLQATWEGVG